MCLQRKPSYFLGDGEETLRARFPPSWNPGFTGDFSHLHTAQTQWSNSTIQTVKQKGKHHKDSNRCSTQHVAICHDPLSHIHTFGPQSTSNRRKKKHTQVNTREFREESFMAAEPQESNSCWATPAIHHIMLLSTAAWPSSAEQQLDH